MSTFVNLARETALWLDVFLFACLVLFLTWCVLDEARWRREQGEQEDDDSQWLRKPAACPWCDDPDEIDNARCYCLTRCPVGICMVGKVRR